MTMKIILITVGVLSAIITLYILGGRSWLKKKYWAVGFFDWIEPIEVRLYKKSETILFARMKMLTGVTLMVLAQAGTIDLSVFMPFVPDQWEPLFKLAFNFLPLIITALGAMDEKLRRDTTKPLELVAVVEKDLKPEVAQAFAAAEVAKADAVAAQTIAKAEEKAEVAEAEKDAAIVAAEKIKSQEPEPD